MTIYFDFEIRSEGDRTKFDVINFTAREWISKPFEVSLELALHRGRQNDNEIYFDNVLGKEAILTISSEYSEREESIKTRYFHGIIRMFEKIGYEKNLDRVIYKALLAPELWKLSLRKNYRIFQKLPVLKKTLDNDPNSIVEEIFKEEFRIAGGIIKYENSIQTAYPSRDYCAQFNETDLNFITRLLEEEGIFYYFRHSDEEHKIIFGDSYNDYDPSIDYVKFNDETDKAAEDYVYDFKLSRRLHPDKVKLRDFDFAYMADAPPEGYAVFDADGKRIFENPEQDSDSRNFTGHEVYEYPAAYTQHFTRNPSTQTNTPPISTEENKIYRHLIESRMDEATMYRDIATGESTCARFCPGFYFKLIDHDKFDDNKEDNEKEYVLTEVVHTGSYSIGSGDTTFYNTFKGIPSRATFRPERITPKAVVRGPQTAIVVNAQGEITGTADYTDGHDNTLYDEVNTDEHGRVQVRFHWQRPWQLPENNPNYDYNKAWVRVSQAWAGHGWGSMHIPHVGQEVIVDFLNGDPDRPIITGRVYNGENIPHNAGDDDTMNPSVSPHISGFRDEYGNKLVFDSKRGEERVVLKSPKNDSYLSLGADGAELKTTADVTQRVLGNILEIGCGTQLEGFLGLGVEGKLAQSYEVFLGQALELFAGNKMEFGFGTEYSYTKSKDLKQVDGDICHECNRDYKLVAGDGLSILGGTEDTSNNRSILSAFADGIILSLGSNPATAGAGDWKAGTVIGTTVVSSIVGAVFALFAKIFDATAEGTDVDEFTFANHSFGVLTSIVALAQSIISIVIGIMEDDSVEPSYHKDPLAVLGMNEEGITLGIEPDLQQAKAELTLIQNQIAAKKAIKKSLGLFKKSPVRRELADLQTQEREIWKNFIKASLGENTVAKSKIMMRKDGSVNINSDGDVKNIYLCAGDKSGNDNSIISLRQTRNASSNLNGISLMADGTKIKITKGSSITIDTSFNDADIELNAGQGTVNIDASEVEVAGSTFSRTQGATIASNLRVQP